MCLSGLLKLNSNTVFGLDESWGMEKGGGGVGEKRKVGRKLSFLSFGWEWKIEEKIGGSRYFPPGPPKHHFSK